MARHTTIIYRRQLPVCLPQQALLAMHDAGTQAILSTRALHLTKWSFGPWSSEDPDATLTFLPEKPEQKLFSMLSPRQYTLQMV